MYGGTWGEYVQPFSSPFQRIVQHSMPSYAKFLEQVAATPGDANKGQLYIQVEGVGNQAVNSVTRNSYTSTSAASGPAQKVTRLIYWDYADGVAREMNPYAMTGPTDLIW